MNYKWLSVFLLSVLLCGADAMTAEAPAEDQIIRAPGKAERKKVQSQVNSIANPILMKFRNTGPQALACSEELMAQVAKNQNPTIRFMLMEHAYTVLMNGKKFLHARRTLDQIGREYPGFEMTRALGVYYAKVFASLKADELDSNFKTYLEYLKALVDAKQLSEAKSFLDAIRFYRTKLVKCEDYKSLAELEKEISRQEAEQKRFARALTELKKDPGNPELNQKMAEYLILLEENWEKALPCFAKGNSLLIRNNLVLETAKDPDAKKLLKLGNFWWDYAAQTETKSKPLAAAYRRHAASFYALCIKDIPPKKRPPLEARMKEAGVANPLRIEEARHVIAPELFAAGPKVLPPSKAGFDQRFTSGMSMKVMLADDQMYDLPTEALITRTIHRAPYTILAEINPHGANTRFLLCNGEIRMNEDSAANQLQAWIKGVLPAEVKNPIAGKLNRNVQWSKVRITVLPDRIVFFVNNELRHIFHGDFSKLSAPVGIYTTGSDVLEVKNYQVFPGSAEPNVQPDPEPLILEAVYAGAAKSLDRTWIAAFNLYLTGMAPANSVVFRQDPDPNSPKMLHILYLLNGDIRTASTQEGGVIPKTAISPSAQSRHEMKPGNAKEMNVVVSIEGSGKILFNGNSATYLHESGGKPGAIWINGEIWETVDTAFQDVPKNLPLDQAKLKSVHGRGSVSLSMTELGLVLSIADPPAGRGFYAVTLSFE